MKVHNIKELFELTFSVKSNEQIKFNLGKVNSKVALKIKEITGIDVQDYEHIIDNFAIRHAISKHGNSLKEEKRGQIAVNLDYLEKLREVIKNPDSIVDGGINDIGRRVIIYEKRIDGIVVYLEEIRTKRKELATQTMYIKKAH